MRIEQGKCFRSYLSGKKQKQKQKQMEPTMSMLLGREDYASPQEQVGLKGEALEGVSKTAIATWKGSLLLMIRH